MPQLPCLPSFLLLRRLTDRELWTRSRIPSASKSSQSCHRISWLLILPVALLRRVLGVFARREFAVLDVVCIKFRVVLPLFGKVIQRKNRGDRTDRHAGPKIDAFHGINVELGDLIEARTAVIVSRVFLRVNAIYGAGIHAGGVFCPNAGFGNDIGHGPPPLCRSTHYASAREDSSGGQGFPLSRRRIRSSRNGRIITHQLTTFPPPSRIGNEKSPYRNLGRKHFFSTHDFTNLRPRIYRNKAFRVVKICCHCFRTRDGLPHLRTGSEPKPQGSARGGGSGLLV